MAEEDVPHTGGCHWGYVLDDCNEGGGFLGAGGQESMGTSGSGEASACGGRFEVLFMLLLQ